MRGATRLRVLRVREFDISIHAPLAGSDGTSPFSMVILLFISIHAPLAGSDQLLSEIARMGDEFQSTLPLRGATRPRDARPDQGRISIHAPLAGSDTSGAAGARRARNFNPRSPCGERRCCRMRPGSRRNFNPRSPCGERPAHLRHGITNHTISIHAPLAGSDPAGRCPQRSAPDFNPRSPCGERPASLMLW